MIIIFLNNKLITCDTIVPLIKELSDVHKLGKAEFVCFDFSTYLAIKENEVINDAIISIGRLKMLGRKYKNSSKFIHLFRVFPIFAYYVFMGIVGRAVFLHFKALNKWPLKFFAVCFPNKTVLSESSAIGYSSLEKSVSEMIRSRNYDKNIPMGKNILAFSKNWEVLEDPRIKIKKTIFIHPPFNRKYWIDYILSCQKKYFDRIFNKSNIEPSDYVISYMLCWMGPNNQTRKPNLYPKLFDETLSVLEQTCPKIPIFIKPHPSDAGNKDSLNLLLKIMKKHPKLKLILMHLHPMVLACRTKFFIANTYTTTFAVAKYNDIPCIEYTDYKESILKATNNRSMRPDMVTHFINRDINKLKLVIKKLMLSPNIKISDGNKEPLPNEFIEIFH